MNRRRGTTLPELLVALTLFSIVGAVCLRALGMSARWYERVTLVTEQRAQSDAARRLVADLPAAAAPAEGDLVSTGTSDLTWLATIGVAATCRVLAGAAVLPRGSLARGVELGSFLSPPQLGDLLVILNDGPLTSPADDRWTRHAVVGIHSSTGGCVGGALADPVADASRPAWRLDLAPPLTPADSGAPARLLRAQRLALYPTGGEWMLGFTEVNPPSGWAAIQPAAGPLNPAASAGGGLEFSWLDSLMAANPGSVSAVRARIRAPLRTAARPLPGAAARPVDSSGIVVAFRNRP